MIVEVDTKWTFGWGLITSCCGGAFITTDIGHFESNSYIRICGGEYRVVEDLMDGLNDQSDAGYQKIRKVRTSKCPSPVPRGWGARGVVHSFSKNNDRGGKS